MATTLTPGLAIPLGGSDSGSLQDSAQNPMLMPAFSLPVADGRGGLGYQTPNNALASSSMARAAASATATVGGTAAAGDVVSVTIDNPVFERFGGAQTISVTVGTDTLEQVAEALASGINDNPVCRGFGIRADVAADVVTIKHPGPVGNFTTLSRVNGATSTTITLSAATLSGGAGAILPFGNFAFSYGGQTFRMQIGLPAVMGSAVVAAMVAAGSPIG